MARSRVHMPAPVWTRRSRLATRAVCGVLTTIILATDAAGLTIYRFGRDPEPPPSEKLANPDEVEFIHVNWSDPLDAEQGGQIFQIDLASGTLRPEHYDLEENISLTARNREDGGMRESQNQEGQERAADGDLSTVWFPLKYLCSDYDPRQAGGRPCIAGTDYIAPDRHTLSLDSWEFFLGGFFSIDRVTIVTGLDDASTVIKNFKIMAASGTAAGDFSNTIKLFKNMAEVRDNTSQFVTVRFPPHERVNQIALIPGEHNQNWSVHEIEIYSNGFVEDASYVSDIVEFDQNMAWGDMKWSGREDDGAQLRIHTRSGNTRDQNIYWQITGAGDKLRVQDAAAYRSLALGERAGTTYDFENWTFWSAPYDLADSSGTPVASIGPRKFFQFKVDFIPKNEADGELNFLEFRASEPLASGLVGEVLPAQSKIATSTLFTYYLRPTLVDNATGFNGLEMSSSSVINSVNAVRIDGADWPVTVTPLDEEANPLPGFPAHRFELAFIDTQLSPFTDTGTPVEIDFEARVLRSGAPFDVRVLDTRRPLAVRQKVAAGDANSLIESNSTSVVTTAAVSSVLEGGVEPRVISPNDDGINDAVTISYDLLEIIGHAGVRVDISDLSGRLVRVVYDGDDHVGHYNKMWDGTDDAGNLVPPGTYLYRIKAGSDRDERVLLGIVHVVF